MYNPIRDQEIVNSFPNPTDDYDRVYFNYKCQAYDEKKIKEIVKSVFGYLLLLFLIPLYTVNRAFMRKRKNQDAIFLDVDEASGGAYNYAAVFPEELNLVYSNIKHLHYKKTSYYLSGMIGKTPLKVWFQLFTKHPLNGFVNCLCFVHLMALNRIITMYSPKAIISYRLEFNIASSLMTYFCEHMSVELINFMHGEYVLNKRRAFVRFSKQYIFDDHYVKVFEKTRSPKGQYVTYTPPMYLKDIPLASECEKNLVYYFSGDEGNIELIKCALERLERSGFECRVRPHPRYSDYKLISQTFNGSSISIEDTNSVSIDESLAKANYVVGFRSTVLSQALYLNRVVIVDDLSKPEEYNSMEYSLDVLYYKKHECLSNFLKENELQL